jgi:hypothetical protein
VDDEFAALDDGSLREILRRSVEEVARPERLVLF